MHSSTIFLGTVGSAHFWSHPDLSPSACPRFGDPLTASLGHLASECSGHGWVNGINGDLPDLPGWWLGSFSKDSRRFQSWVKSLLWNHLANLSRLSQLWQRLSSDWKWLECAGPICAWILAPKCPPLSSRAKNPICCGHAMSVGQAMPNWDSPGPQHWPSTRPQCSKNWGPHKVNQVQFGSPNLRGKKSFHVFPQEILWEKGAKRIGTAGKPIQILQFFECGIMWTYYSIVIIPCRSRFLTHQTVMRSKISQTIADLIAPSRQFLHLRIQLTTGPCRCRVSSTQPTW